MHMSAAIYLSGSTIYVEQKVCITSRGAVLGRHPGRAIATLHKLRFAFALTTTIAGVGASGLCTA